ncbi:alpha/beta hydrolase family protein [Hyalangium gracile]|uniref:hypothetical protein n=1 Tax=Hyalangium gracile TaxID=394092 RepID=UPI001CCF0839|nr:hypothetical protein [Hyalangium gracile]
MTNPTLLSEPQPIIGREWSKDSSPERRRLLGLARDALLFIDATGQRYRFEDFRQRPGAAAPPQPEGTESLRERLRKAVEFFTQLRDEPESSAEKARIQVILDALHFISSAGQYGAFEEYLAHVEAGGPPYVMAAFATQEEAQAWLEQRPLPPDSASILIANTYHEVVHDDQVPGFRLPRSRALEYYLAELQKEHPPRAATSFGSLDEASAWLQSQSDPPSWAWVLIAGEFYLAAHYRNIHHRALYPLSISRGHEEGE